MDKIEVNEKAVATRRWRNMLISAMSAGEFSSKQRIHLEKLRRKLGISMSEASAMGAELKNSKNNINISGTRSQQIIIFRDILTMIYVDDNVTEKEKKLILKLANKLDINEQELDKHISECKKALAKADEEGKSNISARIFRKVANTVDSKKNSERVIKDYEESTDITERKEMQVSVLKQLNDLSAKSAQGNAKNRNLVITEDKECIKMLIAANAITESQVLPFLKEQTEMFENKGKIVSILTLMVNNGIIERKTADNVRALYRDGVPVPDSNLKSMKSDNDTLTVEYYKDTLDYSFYITVIKPTGQIDQHTTRIIDKIFDEISANNSSDSRLIIMDFEDVEYIGSAAIGSILASRKSIMERWGDLRFCNVSDNVKDIMNLIGVDTFIEIHDNLESAKWSFSTQNFDIDN